MSDQKLLDSASKSITSVKTLTWDNSPAIRAKSQGVTDLIQIEKDVQCSSERDIRPVRKQNDDGVASNGKIINPQKAKNNQQEQLPLLPRLITLKERGSDQSIWSEYYSPYETMLLKIPQENTKSSVRINSIKVCRCSKCVSNISVSEPDLEFPRDLAANDNNCLRDKPPKKQSDLNLDLNDKDRSKKLNNGSRPFKGKHDSKSSLSGCSKVLTKFEDCDSSAVFHKVFSVDGVGLECHCCISSFKSPRHKKE